jgi:hypothetical protein
VLQLFLPAFYHFGRDGISEMAGNELRQGGTVEVRQITATVPAGFFEFVSVPIVLEAHFVEGNGNG